MEGDAWAAGSTRREERNSGHHAPTKHRKPLHMRSDVRQVGDDAQVSLYINVPYTPKRVQADLVSLSCDRGCAIHA